jgi:hypothetical protein
MSDERQIARVYNRRVRRCEVVVSWLALLSLRACSADDGDGGDGDAAAADAGGVDAVPHVCDAPGDPTFGVNPGFVWAADTTEAYEWIGGIWTLRGPADWSCRCTPSDDIPT